MASQFVWVLLAALLSAPVLAHEQNPGQQGDRQSRDARPQDPNRWKWWINPENRKELGITDAQSAQIDQIFESTMPAQRAKWREAEQLKTALSKTLKENTADVATVTPQIERVEKLEAELRTNRAVMLYRINLLLTPDQRVKLEAFLKRRDENRRREPGKTERHQQRP